MSLENDIKQKALQLGFDLAGITDSSPISDKDVRLLKDWLNAGKNGGMSYMQNNFEKRTQPAKLLPGAQSVISLGLNYDPKLSTGIPSKNRQSGRVANFALYEDYHPFIKKLLFRLAEFISSQCSVPPQFKFCVDSAPLAERALAVRAGLGFIGKNHALINPEFGPQIFLAEIVTTLKLEPDKPIDADCNKCEKCVKACPTGALTENSFDARKCISYLTVELKGDIAKELAAKMSNKIFGCDDCVTACPYTKNAPACKNKVIKFYKNRAVLDLNAIIDMTGDQFKKQFKDSTILRTGLESIKRNAGVCLKNSHLENQK